MKTNWQDPQTSEIRSTHISGLQEIAGKIEDILDLQLEAETGVTLTEVYISETDRYRIYQAPLGKRNWAASPAPVIYKNGVQITSGFTIDYGGGAIILSPAATSTDVFTADFSRVKTDGGNRLDKHLTDAINVKAFGASGSTQTTTGDITAGSAVLTLASAIDFKNGQGITVNHAGAACTLATPGAPTVTPTGTAGTTAYEYQIVALDGNGGCTAASAAGATSTGNATLDATNYNALSWTAVTDAVAYAVYGRVSGTMQLLAIVSGTSWNDTGTAAITPPSTVPSTPPATALADTLVTTIVSGGGTTTLTLATTATTTATAQEVGHDDTAAIQAAIDAANAIGGGTVFFPKTTAFYKVSSKIRLYSNITLLGDKYSYIYNDTEVAEPVFEITGTVDNRLNNISIKGLKIRNGMASTGGYTSSKDGIVVKYCNGFKLEDCYITEIQGAFGLSTRYSTNIKVVNNVFYRCTYSQFFVFPECENILVEGNIFDTCTSTMYANIYLFATGGDATVDGWFCKNVWIRNNKFLNNPRWEGIDSHGCENLWIEDNYIENVRIGIMVGLALSYVNNPVLKNVYVRNNVIIQGTGKDEGYGITVQGAYNDTTFQPATNVFIEDNLMKGFGYSTSTTSGTLTLYIAVNVKILNNRIEEFKGIGIPLYHTNTNILIEGNEIVNPVASNPAGTRMGISLRSIGNYYITIRRNRIFYDDVAKAFTCGIRTDSNYVHSQIRDNYILATNKYENPGPLPVMKSAIPSGIFGLQTDMATDTNDKITYACTDNVMRFDSTKSSGITVNGTAGSNELTIASGDFRYVCEGLEVVIAGAGDAGANLTSTIVKVTNTKIWLKDNVLTTVSGATLSYTSATWVAI